MAPTVLNKETVTHAKLVGTGRILGDTEYVNCTFEGGTLAQYEDAAFGLQVHDVTLRRCRTGSAVLHGVEFRDVTVERLASGGRLMPAACVFRHVTLIGAMPALKLMPVHSSLSDETKEAFRKGAERYYQDDEWALDISQAQFSDAEFSGVPGHLVKRDPATQFLVHRDRAEAADPEGLSTRALSYLKRAQQSAFPSTVIVAPTKSKYFDKLLAGLEMLRSRGIAE